ncbi:hypothetical protein SRHO_G00117160 [Serrasalmus rhombeus]
MSCVCLVLGLVLLMAISSDAAARPIRPPDPPQCCSNFVTFTIPQEEIIDTVKTPSSCPEQGYMITTHKGQYCKRSLSRSTKPKPTVPPVTFRITTPQARVITHPDQCCLHFVSSKIPEKEIIKVEKTPSDCPKQGYMVTTTRGKFCMEEDILASSTQQQSTVPSVYFTITTARGKLDDKEDDLVSTTPQQSSVSTVSSSVPPAMNEFCTP